MRSSDPVPPICYHRKIYWSMAATFGWLLLVAFAGLPHNAGCLRHYLLRYLQVSAYLWFSASLDNGYCPELVTLHFSCALSFHFDFARMDLPFDCFELVHFTYMKSQLYAWLFLRWTLFYSCLFAYRFYLYKIIATLLSFIYLNSWNN